MLASYLGDHASADEHLRIAIKESERLGSRYLLARALVTAGEAQVRRGALPAARDFAAQALAIGNITPDLERRARSLTKGVAAPLEHADGHHAGIVSRARSVVSIGGRSALARLTRNSGDDALIRNARSATAQRTLFTALARSYQPTFAYGFEGVIMVELDTTVEGSEPTVDTWSIEVTAKKARARRGPSTAPAVTVQLNAADFVRLVAGTLNPIQAFKEHRLTVQGDVLIAARMDEMFGGVAPN
jgi:hypothetical protein